jgi:hypothetical protein
MIRLYETRPQDVFISTCPNTNSPFQGPGYIGPASTSNISRPQSLFQCVLEPPLNCSIKRTRRSASSRSYSELPVQAKPVTALAAYHYGPFQGHHQRQSSGNHYADLPVRLATDVRQLYAGLSAAKSSFLSASVPQSSPAFRNYIERPSLHPLFIVSRA